jgi:hypothetical protein
MHSTDVTGNKQERYEPKYWVFWGFHLSTCKTLLAPLILIDSAGIRLHHFLEQTV